MVIFQLVTSVSLAIFSKSRWTFAVLSAAHLYVLYQSIYNRRVWIDLDFLKYVNSNRVDFKYEELFLVKTDAGKEVSAELTRLRKEEGEFKLFNGPQATIFSLSFR